MGKPMNALSKSPQKYTFKTHESYSPEEIIAAGGTTAFAHKIGKTYQNMMDSIKNAPNFDVEFTDEEWDDLMEQLKNDK
jgi:hypothetical protein